MRKNESAAVVEMFNELGLGKNFHFIDATGPFLAAMEGKIDPEAKRRAIGDTFISVFESEARRLGIEDHLLGQGTIYPDTIESGATKRAETIKTHHNRVPIIEEMIAAGKVIEPLADLYKVEVRELGELLGIPSDMIWRHPFPGPGLGIRLLCSDGVAEGEDQLAKISSDVAEVAQKYGLEATALPVKSVGVKADLRSYEHPVLIQGGFDADADNEPDWNRLQEAAGNIFKSVGGINRALWNMGDRMPENFRLQPASMTSDRLDLLRECDHLMMDGLRRHNLYGKIWQCPTVLIPLEVDGVGKELCILRPIHSERAMTATAACLPAKLLKELQASITALPGISGLAYDLTSKPPGTIEWE